MAVKKLIAILIGITLFAYASSFSNPFIWDDEQFIQKNVYVQHFDIAKIFTTNTVAGAGIVSNYYRPLTSLSFAIDAKIWGQNAFGFHLTNFLLHLGAGLLLFFILQQIGLGKLFSFAVSSIFLVHPIQTEAVTYINSRGDSQYTFFFFLSLLLFLIALHGKKRKVLLFVLSVVAYLVSLFSKETAMAGFPIYIVLSIVYYVKNVKTKKVSLGSWITAGIISFTAIGYFLLRISILNFQNTLDFYGSTNFYSTHLLVRLFTFAKVLWIYIGLLLFPYPLHMERSVSLVTGFLSPFVLGAIALLFVLVVLSIWEIKMYKTYYIGFGFILAGSFLVPVSGIIPINGVLYEHWLYIPMVGFFLVLFRVLQICSSRVPEYLKKILGIIGIVLLCCIYMVLTIRQNNIWSNPLTFYTYTLAYAPNSARVHNNLGMAHADNGQLDASIIEYKKALALTPDLPQVYNNLGISYQRKGDIKDSEAALQKALSLAPQFQAAQINLMALYLTHNEYAKVLPLMQSISKYYTHDVRFLYSYGKTLWKLHKYTLAEEQFAKAIAASENNPDVISQINQLKASM